MVPLIGGIGRFDEPVVLDQVGIPVIGLAAEETVEAVEAFGKRPLRAAAACGDVLLGDVVVLAEPEGAESVVLQELADGRALSRQPSGGAGEPVRAFGDRRVPVDVMVAPGQEGRPGR